MNKINYFFGYLLFRMKNRWKSKKNIVVPDSYSEPLFDTIILFPLTNITFFIFGFNDFFGHKKYFGFNIILCFILTNT